MTRAGGAAAARSAWPRSTSAPASSCWRRSRARMARGGARPPASRGARGARRRGRASLPDAGPAPSSPRASAGSSTPSSRARSWPAASGSPRSTDSASGPTTTPRSAPRARCCATSPSCSPAGCPISPGRWCGAASAFLWLDEMTRRNLELVEPLRAGARGLHAAGDDRPHGDADGRAAAAPVAALAAARARRDRGPTRRGGSRGARRPGPGARCARRSTACATSSGSPAGPPRAAPTPRELGALRDSFQRLPDVAEALDGARRDRAAGRAPSALLADRRARPPRRSRRASSPPRSTDRPPATLADGGVIRPGYDAELDELRVAARRRQAVHRRAAAAGAGAHRDRVAQGRLQQGVRLLPRDHERARGRVPRRLRAAADAHRRRALRDARAQGVRGEGARRRGADRGARGGAVRRAARAPWAQPIARIQRTARVLARLDVWAALAEVAVAERYVRPEVHDGFDLELRASRHPVVERMMPRETFIPNDVRFTAAERVLLVTGPNMAGKSTILRQIGLCVVLAQIGRLRARGGGDDRGGGPAVHPRRARATTWRAASPPSWWR